MSRGSGSSYRRGGGGPPAWLVFVVGVALVFGIYYVWLGVQNFLRTGGKGVVEATERAEIISTATAVFLIPTRNNALSATPLPNCQDFVISVPIAIVREAPNKTAPIVDQLPQGQVMCVFGRSEVDPEWYTVNMRPESRRIELAYMHESVIEAVNPTPTPSRTVTALPTVTPTPSPTATQTAVPRPTETYNPDITNTPRPTPTPTLTPPLQSA